MYYLPLPNSKKNITQCQALLLRCYIKENSKAAGRGSLLPSPSIFGLPVLSVTVGATVIVPSQARGTVGVPLALAQTILVALPVKVLHISHVQSIGRVVEVKLDGIILQRMEWGCKYVYRGLE